MDYEEAAKAALELKPKVAIPVHYKGVVTDPEAGELFKEEIGGKINVVILPTKNF
jgi:L-ascorbate metabolism protein UlaG (beta-lactamase superfamily)